MRRVQSFGLGRKVL